MAIVNQQNVQVKSGSTWYKVCPFPVGFIYLSQNSTSPATTFGGTWAALNEDRFLRPSNAWTTGGSKKISTDQMPSHTHKYGNYFSIVYDWTDVDPIHVIASGTDLGYEEAYYKGIQSTGGQGLLASIPRLLWVVSDCLVLTKSVSDCLVFTSWMEVNANDYIG